MPPPERTTSGTNRREIIACLCAGGRTTPPWMLQWHSVNFEIITPRRLEDVGPHTWSQLSNGTTLSNAPMAFYDQPLDPAAARRGDQAPVRIRWARPAAHP